MMLILTTAVKVRKDYCKAKEIHLVGVCESIMDSPIPNLAIKVDVLYMNRNFASS